MRVIHKFNLEPGINNIPLPRTGVKILTVREQHGKVTIWIDMDDEKPTINRVFNVVPTGEFMAPDNSKYIGTAHLDNGYKVWHVYG